MYDCEYLLFTYYFCKILHYKKQGAILYKLLCVSYIEMGIVGCNIWVMLECCYFKA